MKLAIIGGRSDGHAGVVIDILREKKDVEIVCIFDNSPELWGKKILGVPIVGCYKTELNNWVSRLDCLHIAIGDNSARDLISRDLISKGLNLYSVLHPSAVISPSAYLSEGCFVGPNAVVQSNATIGVATIVNSAVVVEHDCNIGNFVHLAPGVVLAGRVHVCDRVFLGIGTLVAPDVQIGYAAFSSAGSVITKNIADYQILLGYRATLGESSLYERIVKKK